MRLQRWLRLVHRAALVWALISLCHAHAQVGSESDWPNYGNDPGGMRHSPLSQINRENVAKLKVAWVFRVGDISEGHDGRKRSGFETTPILVDGMLYLTTPFNRVIALDPATGKQLWAYDPKIDQKLDYGDGLVNRGVATWLDISLPAAKVCKRRIFEATLDARLIALDARTGVPCPDFGSAGQVNLGNIPGYQRTDLGEPMQGWYHMTSPPATIDDMVIVGSSINDNNRVDMPSGVVRAFDARNGALRLQSDVPGEKASATQPFPLLPPALTPQHISVEDAWGPTPADRQACKEAMRKLRNEGIFTPPSVQGTLAVPGNLGGITWSGYAFDPPHNLLIVNTNNLIARVRLIPRDKVSSEHEDGDVGLQRGGPYAMLRRFLQSPSDLPCGAPPWGSLTAIDMVKGTIRWQVPVGSMQNFGGAHGSVPPGSISLGGPITTAGGLVFIAGTPDARIRAFDIETGKEVWRMGLPAAGGATPMTYEAKGKQYLVIAAGGHKVISEESLGDSLVAFALP